MIQLSESTYGLCDTYAACDFHFRFLDRGLNLRSWVWDAGETTRGSIDRLILCVTCGSTVDGLCVCVACRPIYGLCIGVSRRPIDRFVICPPVDGLGICVARSTVNRLCVCVACRPIHRFIVTCGSTVDRLLLTGICVECVAT